MTGNTAPSQADARRTVISVDAMGGDAGPAVVVAGIAKSASDRLRIRVIQRHSMMQGPSR